MSLHDFLEPGTVTLSNPRDYLMEEYNKCIKEVFLRYTVLEEKSLPDYVLTIIEVELEALQVKARVINQIIETKAYNG